MTTLIFAAEDVRRVVAHAYAAPGHSQSWAEREDNKKLSRSRKVKPRPQVLLVHDDGVYLMSNGEPRDLIGDPPRSFCAYADGLSPENPDCWELAREAVGGDDFAEWIDLDPAWVQEILLRGATLEIDWPTDGSSQFGVTCR